MNRSMNKKGLVLLLLATLSSPAHSIQGEVEFNPGRDENRATKVVAITAIFGLVVAWIYRASRDDQKEPDANPLQITPDLNNGQ